MYRQNTWGRVLDGHLQLGPARMSKHRAAFSLEELAKVSIALRSRRLFGHIVTYGWQRGPMQGGGPGTRGQPRG